MCIRDSRNSRFVHSAKPWPWSIKLEGSRRLGFRKVSLIHLDPADLSKVPADVLVYGRNGVQAKPVEASQRELGIIVQVTGKTREAAVLLASLLTHYLIHYGYAGRKATAGNIAYPLSPNLISFAREDGSFGAIVPSGTRDPVFFENYAAIKAAVLKLIADEFPDALANATYAITDADASHPVALLRTVDRNADRLAQRHQQEIDRITQFVKPGPGSLLNLDAPDAYAWSLYHLLQNEDVIKNTMFPITYFAANGADWTQQGSERPRYFDIGERNYRGNVDDRTLSLIADHPPAGAPVGSHPLLEMAVVIRSKDAGINRLTFDIIFTSGENYEAALHSNVFTRCNVAKILNLPPERVVGTYFVDSCNAIKISVDRPNISASMDERDVFGAQQVAIEQLSVPIYSIALAKASSF